MSQTTSPGARSDFTPAWIFLAGLALLLPQVWRETSITGGDEYWLSFRTPMEMLARGEYWTPWLNGEPRLQKPPLLYWLILLTYQVGGIHLICARLWGVLAGAGLAALTCLLARALGWTRGATAGMLALATIGIAVEGRRAMLDLPVAFFATLAVLSWVRWFAQPRLRHAALLAISLGLAWMTKGPVGLLFFGAGAATHWLCLRPVPPPRQPWWHLLGAGLVALAICLPWPLLMRHWWPEQWQQTLAQEFQARDFTLNALKAPFSAGLGALGLAFPWSLMVVASVGAALRRPPARRDGQALWLAAWLGASLLPFLFMRTFERYLLGLLPAQCLLTVWWWEAADDRRRNALLIATRVLVSLPLLFFSLFAVWFRLAYFWPAVLTAGVAALWIPRFLGSRKPADSTTPTHEFVPPMESLEAKRFSADWNPEPGRIPLTRPSGTLSPMERDGVRGKRFIDRNPSSADSGLSLGRTAGMVALLLAVLLGGLYPQLGINALPVGLETSLRGFSVRQFSSSQPSMLSMRLGSSVQSLEAGASADTLRAIAPPLMVFVEPAMESRFREWQQAQDLPVEEAGRFATFFSRQAWLRFTRRGATWDDWREAIRQRSLENLKTEIRYYRVTPKALERQPSLAPAP